MEQNELTEAYEEYAKMLDLNDPIFTDYEHEDKYLDGKGG